MLGDRGYFDVSPRGRVTVEPDGFMPFEEASQGDHAYLILRPEQQPRVLEALVQLSSQPPQQVEKPDHEQARIGKTSRSVLAALLER